MESFDVFVIIMVIIVTFVLINCGILMFVNNLFPLILIAPTYRKWKVTENSRVTHDTRLLRLKAPPGYIMSAPVGYHIHIINNISGAVCVC